MYQKLITNFVFTKKKSIINIAIIHCLHHLHGCNGNEFALANP